MAKTTVKQELESKIEEQNKQIAYLQSIANTAAAVQTTKAQTFDPDFDAWDLARSKRQNEWQAAIRIDETTGHTLVRFTRSTDSEGKALLYHKVMLPPASVLRNNPSLITGYQPDNKGVTRILKSVSTDSEYIRVLSNPETGEPSRLAGFWDLNVLRDIKINSIKIIDGARTKAELKFASVGHNMAALNMSVESESGELISRPEAPNSGIVSAVNYAMNAMLQAPKSWLFANIPGFKAAAAATTAVAAS